MRLLLAVDSVLTTQMLLDTVASRPWPAGTRARVLSVVEDEMVSAEAWREAGYRVDAVRQEMRRRGEQVSALAVEQLGRLGIETEVVAMRGDPRWLITRQARKWRADLILIRAHNRTDFRNWMLGSVARAIVREAPCPVEVVRRAAPANGHLRILLATDGAEHSEAAARSIAERPWPAGAEVKVMSMVSPLRYSLEEIGLSGGGRTEQAHRAIGAAAEILKGAAAKISGEVVAGSPAKRILEEARDWGADLIVVGTRDNRGLRRLLSGSVSEAVAAGATCSVKVVRGAGTRPEPRR